MLVWVGLFNEYSMESMKGGAAPARIGNLFWLAAAILAADQLTKVLITSQMTLGQSIPVIADFMHFTLVRNTGMAFGILSRADIPFKTALVTLLSGGAMVAVGYYALKAPPSERLTRGGLACILGGALGNITDRLRLGYVVDFIDVFYRDTHWPAFNIADSCICIGVGLLLLDGFRRPEPTTKAEISAPIGAGQGES